MNWILGEFKTDKCYILLMHLSNFEFKGVFKLEKLLFGQSIINLTI
jgi:hypothetical protein